jgi:hypothetical protein
MGVLSPQRTWTLDSDDNVEIPIKTTAMAPPNARLASINELISIIVLTSLHLRDRTAIHRPSEK